MSRLIAKYRGVCACGAKVKPGDSVDYFKPEKKIVACRICAGSVVDHNWGIQARTRNEYEQQVSDVFKFSSGHVAYRNKIGRCEDAPCCGCCTI